MAKIKYVVRGKSRNMYSSYDYKKALAFFHKHPRASGIQRYNDGVTAGFIQPTIPNKVKMNGVTYDRAYQGGHSKKTASDLVRGFKKGGHSSFARKTKHGYQVFVHVKGD